MCSCFVHLAYARWDTSHSDFREGLTTVRQSWRMKRYAVLFSLALLTGLPASADTLADQVRAEAARLLAQVNAAEAAARAQPAAKPQAVTTALSADLQRFGLAASRLSVEIDRRGGPTDLRCIFRGMAEETDKQLAAAGGATTGADQAKAYARLTDMLKDAVEIAPAVGGMPPVKAGAARASATQCPALRQL
jgi:hypothetical protein